MQIGKVLGTPIKVDTTTSMATRVKFARLCVEIDLSKSLLTRVQVGSLSQAIEYEALHTVSFSCGIVGHRMDKCPAHQPPSESNTKEAAASDKPDMETRVSTANYGPWMLVQRKFRRGSTQKVKAQQNGRDHDSSNRFVALDSLENMEDEIPVNEEVIEAWNKGLRGDSARLSPLRKLRRKQESRKLKLLKIGPPLSLKHSLILF